VPENHRHEAPGAQLDKLHLNRARQRHPHGASRSATGDDTPEDHGCAERGGRTL
jgi:hypothetical protein